MANPIYDWLSHQTVARPQGIALLAGDQQWTYTELHTQVTLVAAKLAAAGIEAGQHVAVLMPNRPDYVFVIHALTRLGAVLIPLNTRLSQQELHWQLHNADCEFLLCSEETEADALILDHEELTIISLDPVPDAAVASLIQYPIEDTIPFERRLLDLDATQVIVHTSGTTGQPKGVMLTYGNLFWSATASAYRLGMQPDERWLLCMPLYHVGALSIVMRSCLYGTTVVLGPSRFDVPTVNQMISRHHVTLISLVPTMLQWLLDHREGVPFPATLRCVLLGGAAAPLDLVDRCLDIGVPIALTYGLSEASSQVATATPEQVRRKPGSVGKPLMFGSVRVVDDDGQDRPVGEMGQIVVASPSVMTGYYKLPEATDKIFGLGALQTGDLGYLDEEGDLWMVQRRNDLILSGGENVYPVEVELVINSHPLVAASCVVGVDDAQWGQRVTAAVVLHQGATLSTEDLVEFCKAELAKYKQPRLITFVQELPMTGSGKIQRREVAEMMTKIAAHQGD